MTDEPTTMEGESTTVFWPQCWAYGPSGQRCEQKAGHAQVHTVTVAWDDDECVTPHVTVIGETRTARPVPILGIEDLDDDDESPTSMDYCASCGWPEVGHEANNVGCKNFA